MENVRTDYVPNFNGRVRVSLYGLTYTTSTTATTATPNASAELSPSVPLVAYFQNNVASNYSTASQTIIPVSTDNGYNGFELRFIFESVDGSTAFPIEWGWGFTVTIPELHLFYSAKNIEHFT
jgi:hypothetical protein